MRRLLLILLVLATASVACKGRTKHLYLPAPGTTIDITFKTPVGVVTGTSLTFAAVCGGAQSYLVSLGIDTTSATSYSYRFLFDDQGKIWGCSGSGPCADQTVNAALPVPARVLFEGIDVPASGFANAATYNIVCRGIADRIIGMGTLTASPIPTPSAGPTPQPVSTNVAVSVEIPILRVGDINPTFTTAGPLGGHVAAASFGDVESARLSTGGIIVAGGGDGGQEVFEFQPWRIGTFPGSASSLAEFRVDASAAAFLDSAGRPSILFVGGRDLSQTSKNDGEIYRRGNPGTVVVSNYVPYLSLSFTNAYFLPGHIDGGAHVPAVVVVGGLNNPNATFFFPAAPIDLANCGPGAVVGRPAFCIRGSGTAMGDGGHTRGVSANLGGGRIFTGMGYLDTNATSSKSYVFDAESFQDFPVASSSIFAKQNFDVPVADLSTGYVGFFGGGNGSNTNGWGFIRKSDGSVVAGSGTLVGANAENAVSLRDGRVFIIHGTGVGSEHSVEVFTPVVASGSAGTFAPISKLGAVGCVSGEEASCVQLSMQRSFAVARRIDQSLTWLNGSVVVQGGPDGSVLLHATEIFVPAYQCSGVTPVRWDGITPVPGADFCDRARVRQAITDPRVPDPFASP